MWVLVCVFAYTCGMWVHKICGNDEFCKVYKFGKLYQIYKIESSIKSIELISSTGYLIKSMKIYWPCENYVCIRFRQHRYCYHLAAATEFNPL